MQLVHLEMYGFKSFANKTEFSFSPGITAFVGPNGCGKSNVVDAIRWVLGEQNPRILRAIKMEDLIYAGSENSQHKNYAEVSIILDNEDNEIPLDFQEITVTRRYYRSGDSEYFLNKVPCRLKDISEALASTALGKGTYSIIGQGQVEEVISSRPEDRRLMFEEAAGIALFKLRKRDALKKLSDTHVNLTRIEDIYHELQSQEEEIREGAVRAEEYLGYKEQADNLELSLWAGRFQDLQNRLERLDLRRQELEESRGQYLDHLQTADHVLAEAMAKMQESADIIGDLEENKSQLTEHKRELEYKLRLSEERQLDYQNMVAASQQQVTRLKVQLEESSSGAIKVHDLVSALDGQVAVYGGAFKRRNVMSGLVRRLLAAAEEYQGQADAVILQATMESTEAAAHQGQAQQAELELVGQLESVMNEITSWRNDAAQAQAEINKLQVVHTEMEEKYRTLSTEHSKVCEISQGRERNRDALVVKATQMQGSQNALRQKIEMLETMAQELQGFSPGTRTVLQAGRDGKLAGILGAIAELIEVKDPGHSLAVETALGGALNYVVCTDEDTCRRAIEMLKKSRGGRATLVPVTAAASRTHPSRADNFSQPVLGWADELVSCSGPAASVVAMLLGNVLVAEDLAVATKLALEIKYRYKIVTLEGDVISRGLFTGGSSGKNNQGLLQRKVALAELKQQLQGQHVEFTQLQQAIARESADCQNLVADRNSLASGKEEVEREMFRIQTTVDQVKVRVSQAEEREAGCQLKMAELQAKMDHARRVLAGVSSRINAEKTSLELSRLRKDKFQGIETELREMVSLWASRQNSLQLAVYSLQNLREDRHRQLTNLQTQVKELGINLATMESEVLVKQGEYSELTENMARFRHALSELSQGLESVSVSLDGQIVTQKTIRMEIGSTNKNIAGFREELENVNSALHEAELRAARWQTEAEAMVRELATQFGKDPQSGLEHLDQRFTINEMAGKLKKLRGRMQELGEVNLATISQHKKLVGRLEFLREQMLDLNRAEEDILNLVAELDSTIRTLFMETFESVQQHFGDIFKVLFAGGSAYLSLSDENDLLETGIEIFARPPGKKTQSLTLLSGGEKSMTAIALLFALQSVRPAPFSILDEIEASLDEVNIVRFADYLRQLSETMQFILITHRREIMERADNLYGITLGKDGSSQPISVALSKVSQGEKAI